MTDGLLQHMWWAIDRFSKHGTRESAALSYYAIFSLFPLALLLIVGVGTVLGPAAAKNQIEDKRGRQVDLGDSDTPVF